MRDLIWRARAGSRVVISERSRYQCALSCIPRAVWESEGTAITGIGPLGGAGHELFIRHPWVYAAAIKDVYRKWAVGWAHTDMPALQV